MVPIENTDKPIYSTDSEAVPALIDDQTMVVLLVVALIVVVGVAVFGIITSIPKFQRELKHVNFRLSQARSQREYNYYIRRRRRLWVSFIFPFVKYKR